MCVCVCMRACVSVCVCAFVCVRVCLYLVRVKKYFLLFIPLTGHFLSEINSGQKCPSNGKAKITDAELLAAGKAR